MSAAQTQPRPPLAESSATQPRKFGPLLDGDQTQFRLWAPAASRVSVLIEGRNAVEMRRSHNGFWIATCATGPGTRYRFDVDGLNVPDPASHFQPRDVHGPSQVIDHRSFVWQHADWAGRPWEETVFYEVHPGIMGGFEGVRARLPALAELGITAIELMPIADFAGSRNWGYDGVLPFAPDSAYGTPDDLRTLIDTAHGLGLMVFLDVVYNHFGPDGNFLHSYAPGFFDVDTPTPWGPAIEFSDPCVASFFAENAHYWLEEFHFDGLRLDAVHAIKSRDWLVALATDIRARLPARHVHLVLENEHNDAALLESSFDAQWNDDFHNVMHVLLTEETHAYYGDFADRPIEKLARCLSQGFIYQGESSPTQNGKPRGQASAHLPPLRFVTFLQNHDQIGNRAFGERLTTLVPKPQLMAATALLLLCPQIPLLFMGEESGATEPFLFFTDFHGELGEAVRAGRQREFANAPGFGPGMAGREVPDPNAPETFEQSHFNDNGPDASEWRHWTKTVLALRRDHIVPHLPGTIAVGAAVVGPKAVIASWQLGNGNALVVAANFGSTPAQANLPTETPLVGMPSRGGEIAPHSTIAWILQ